MMISSSIINVSIVLSFELWPTRFPLTDATSTSVPCPKPNGKTFVAKVSNVIYLLLFFDGFVCNVFADKWYSYWHSRHYCPRRFEERDSDFLPWIVSLHAMAHSPFPLLRRWSELRCRTSWLMLIFFWFLWCLLVLIALVSSRNIQSKRERVIIITDGVRVHAGFLFAWAKTIGQVRRKSHAFVL